MSWLHVLESFVGTGAALLLAKGGRLVASRIAYRAIKLRLELAQQRRRLKK